MNFPLRCLASAVTLAAMAGTARAQCSQIHGFTAAEIQGLGLRRTTNNALIDQRVDAAVTTIAERFGAWPQFYYFDDGTSPNAFSTPEAIGNPGDFPPECARFGTVVLGLRLMVEELQGTRDIMNYSVPAVLAHEWTHTLQFRNNCSLQGKDRELHADYLSGWHIKYLKQTKNPNLDETDVFSRVYKRGDIAFNSPAHHGTPAERLQAFLAGFNSSATTARAAYVSGMNFVHRQRGDENEDSPQEPSQGPPPARRKVLGVAVQPVALGPGSGGLQIQSVAPGSPAQAAGLEPGDIILAANGTPVPDPEAFGRALAGARGPLTLTIIDCRTGRTLNTPPIMLSAERSRTTPPPGGGFPPGSFPSGRAFPRGRGFPPGGDAPPTDTPGGPSPSNEDQPATPPLDGGFPSGLGRRQPRSSRGDSVPNAGGMKVETVAVGPGRDGLRVRSVEPGSSAQRAGFEPGDIILAVNGRAVRDPEALGSVVGAAQGPLMLTIIDARTGMMMATPPVTLSTEGDRASPPDDDPSPGDEPRQTEPSGGTRPPDDGQPSAPAPGEGFPSRDGRPSQPPGRTPRSRGSVPPSYPPQRTRPPAYPPRVGHRPGDPLPPHVNLPPRTTHHTGVRPPYSSPPAGRRYADD